MIVFNIRCDNNILQVLTTCDGFQLKLKTATEGVDKYIFRAQPGGSGNDLFLNSPKQRSSQFNRLGDGEQPAASRQPVNSHQLFEITSSAKRSEPHLTVYYIPTNRRNINCSPTFFSLSLSWSFFIWHSIILKCQNAKQNVFKQPKCFFFRFLW